LKDVVQLERALVIAHERRALFSMVRAGPALATELKGNSAASKYEWLQKNDLVVKSICLDYCFLDFSRPQYGDVHRRTESLILAGRRVPLWLRQMPDLCNKVNRFGMNSRVLEHIADWPGNFFHKLKRLSTTSDNCAVETILHLLQANPCLESLQILMDNHALPSNWFNEAAKRCGNLRDLVIYWTFRTETDETYLLAVAENCPALRRLRIRYDSSKPPPRAMSRLSEVSMVAVAEGCKQVERITIEHSGMSAGTVLALCARCKNLASIVLPGVDLQLQDLLQLLPQHCKHRLTEQECRGAGLRADDPEGNRPGVVRARLRHRGVLSPQSAEHYGYGACRGHHCLARHRYGLCGTLH
jgi:hypothetical protein